MNECLVTIIIPVYNVEKYLDCCIESVVSQSYKNLEIVLVDDKSPDSCPQKCDSWSLKDNRIKVLHKEINQGLGEARNSGLEIASGKYILFLDSDDYIEKNAINLLVETAEKEDADIVGSGEYGVKESGELIVNALPIQYKIYRDSEIFDEFLPNIIAPDPNSKKKVGFSLCMSGPFFSAKLLKRKDWRCASEREIISEDTYSFIDLCSAVRCVVEIPVFTMYYRMNENSLSHTIRLDREEKNIEFYTKCVNLVRKKGYNPIIESRLVSPYISFVIADLKQLYASDYKNKMSVIYRCLNDNRLISIIKKGNFKGESFPRRAFVFFVRNHMAWLAEALIVLKTGR